MTTPALAPAPAPTPTPGLDEFLAHAVQEFVAPAVARATAHKLDDHQHAPWCWSVDGEEYFPADSEAQAHAEAIDRLESDGLAPGESHAYWLARQRAAEALVSSLVWLGDSIVECLDEHLADEIAADDAIVELSMTDTIALAAIVLAFIRARGGFMRFGIAPGTIVEHTHTAGAV